MTTFAVKWMIFTFCASGLFFPENGERVKSAALKVVASFTIGLFVAALVCW